VSTDTDLADAKLGVGADTLLQVLDPMMTRQMDALIQKFCNAPAELPILLKFQARIAELHRMKRELEVAKRKGASAMKVLEGLMGEENGTPAE